MTLPARIGRYQIEALLGQGGMGAVYKARDPELDRTVAVKTVSPLLLSTEESRREYLERFRREARAAGRLSHPNIVSVYDLGVDGDTVYFVMEYVPGVSLEAVLKENPVLPLSQAAGIVEQIASGLEEAHRQGVVHRDVKPANVFLDDRGRVKVGDFGIARVEGSELTQTGVGLGTPGYSAPEVLRGGAATARSDVFALGVLAYRLFSGQRPFAGTRAETLSAEILEHDPAPPRALRPEVPPHVSDAILHALAKAPDRRTPSADAFVRELRAAPVDDSPPAPDPSRTRTVATVEVPERRRSVRGLAVALGVVLALAAALLAWRALGNRDGETERSGAASVPPGSRPAARVGTSPTARPVARPPTPRPADSVAPALGPEGSAILREAGKKVEELLREQARKADEKARGTDKKPHGRGKGGKKDKDR